MYYLNADHINLLNRVVNFAIENSGTGKHMLITNRQAFHLSGPPLEEDKARFNGAGIPFVVLLGGQVVEASFGGATLVATFEDYQRFQHRLAVENHLARNAPSPGWHFVDDEDPRND